jgi:sphingolipid 8-(E)-desaturase
MQLTKSMRTTPTPSMRIIADRSYHSETALDMLRYFTIGRFDGEWVNFVPPIQGGKFEVEVEDEGIVVDDSSEEEGINEAYPRPPGDAPEFAVDEDAEHVLTPKVQHQITLKYRALDERLWREGYYECHFSHYLPEILRYTALALLSYITLHYAYYSLSAIFLGLMWHQLVFTAHDAGHMGITHSPVIDTTIGIVVADFIGGLSIGWWKKNHNVHHIITNSPEHDPDIQYMPFFAVSEKLLESLRSTYYERMMEYDTVAKVMIQVQHWMFYPLLCFGRFNLYRLSWEHLLFAKDVPKVGITRRFRVLECVGQLFFWYWFGYLLLYRSLPTTGIRIAYLFLSHIVTMPLHVQVTLSHFGMSTTDFGPTESFSHRALRTTMDVDCPVWLDWVHGGLQFQAVHHLFPRIPRHRLREVQCFVKEFCAEMGVKYTIYGFVEGNREVIGRLREVARQARMMKDCHDWLVENKDEHRI